MKNEIIRIRFEDGSLTESQRFARELRDAILGAEPAAIVEMEREDSEATDYHGTLMVVLTTETASPRVMEAIHWWQHRNVEAKAVVDA